MVKLDPQLLLLYFLLVLGLRQVYDQTLVRPSQTLSQPPTVSQLHTPEYYLMWSL